MLFYQVLPATLYKESSLYYCTDHCSVLLSSCLSKLESELADLGWTTSLQ